MFNLLSTEEKKHVANLRVYFILKRIAFFAISLTAIVLISLLFSFLLLDGQNNSLLDRLEQERTIKQDEKIVSINEAITELNQTLSTVSGIQSTYVKWTDRLIELGDLLPTGVTLSSINIKTTDNTYAITGVASTRDTLLQLQSNLEALPYVVTLNSPVTNFTQKENISFVINGEISNEIVN